MGYRVSIHRERRLGEWVRSVGRNSMGRGGGIYLMYDVRGIMGVDVEASIV